MQLILVLIAIRLTLAPNSSTHSMKHSQIFSVSSVSQQNNSIYLFKAIVFSIIYLLLFAPIPYNPD